MPNEKEKKGLEWYVFNGRKYPEFVPAIEKEHTIFRFLSNLKDHYPNLSIWWLEKQYRIYSSRLARVPHEFLVKFLGRFIGYEMGINRGESQDYRFLPSVAMIYAYLQAQTEWDQRWDIADYGKFCDHCRTDESAKEGGFRQVYIRYRDDSGEEFERHYMGICDCEATKRANNVNGVRYDLIIQSYKAKEYPEFEGFSSYYCYKTRRLVSSVEQSAKPWEKRVERGYVGVNESGFYPIWEHSYYETYVGFALALIFENEQGWTMPKERRQQIENKHRVEREAKQAKENGKRRKTKGEGTIGSFLSSMMGG